MTSGSSSPPSIPTSRATASSGKAAWTLAANPWAAATANRLATIVPASDHRWRQPRSPYFQQVRKGIPERTCGAGAWVGSFRGPAERDQGVLEGLVVVHAGAHHVDLHRVEVCRPTSPEEDPLITAGREPGDARGQEQQRPQQLVAELGARSPASRQHLGRRTRRPADPTGQKHGLKVGIDLERAGPVGWVESPERDRPLRMRGRLPVAG